jgi:hypothetical protein
MQRANNTQKKSADLRGGPRGQEQVMALVAVRRPHLARVQRLCCLRAIGALRGQQVQQLHGEHALHGLRAVLIRRKPE